MNLEINSEKEMIKLGQQIADKLSGGKVIELVGDVGAGKTTLTRGIAQQLGVTEPIQSPTFTLQRVYSLPAGGDLVHYDFYRLSDAGIMQDELADQIDRQDAIIIIEWGDIIEGVLPDRHIQITIEATSETGRQVTVRGLEL